MSPDPARPREVTVADVAREARVAKATAARALGGYGAVSDAARSRVLAAADALGYRPNELARSMNTGRSHTIGVVVGDIENPYFGVATRGISDTAKAGGYDVILINTDEEVEAEVDAVRVLLDKRVDGLVVAPCSSWSTGHLAEVTASGRPLVLLDRRLDGLGVDAVEADMVPAARECTRHLVEAGHERIAYVSTADEPAGGYRFGAPLQASPVTDRLAGMAAALDEAGLPRRPEYVRLGARTEADVRRVTRELLEAPEPVTAVIASDSLVGVSVLTAVRELGLRVPEDLSFVMFDDLPWTTLVDPPITVVAQPTFDIGTAAAAVLLERLEGHGGPPRTQSFPARLVRRGSVGPPPAGPRR
ncbi:MULTISPECIES: LacI family DNA-binding transcriptional regulator [Kocuria]|jgi:LacI family transcriptional regulator|uniref:LacI family DNA-binding transcriptional regulator n=1 Tax=Kocuria TaxID=57493 RepID=UPI00203E4D90|nr:MULTISPECIES: LacI family DNA-binding transcriptional regulator [Kocuria]MCM3688550.1 LacI family transcriptional regulator [Kocuria rosea]HST72847.1 LacI family DNA-binding transcriptional regulator [Kocuria rosea]